jgi:tetratricopeptide (TPR) repeat protein
MPKQLMPIKKSATSLPTKKDGILADTLTSEYLQELITFCQVAKQGYALCVCNTPRSQEDLILSLIKRLRPTGVGLYLFKLSVKDKSLGEKLRILLESEKFAQFKNSHKKIVLSITGLDDTIREEEKEFNKRPITLQGINQQRDYFRTLPYPLLIWIPEWLAGRLPEFAPDFWVAKSVVLECLSAPEIVSQSLSQMSGAEIDFENVDAAKRKIRIYQRLIEVSKDIKAKATFMLNLGIIYHRLGNYRKAKELYKQGLAIAQETRDRLKTARAFHQLGMIHQDQGDYKEAVKKYEQSLKIEEELGDKSGVASTLHQLGNIHYFQCDYKEAVEKYEQSLKINEEMGNKSGIAGILHQLGMIHEDQGDYNEAVKKYEQSLNINVELGDKRSIAGTLHQLGNIHYFQGDYKEAVKKYEQSLKIKEELGDKRGIANVLLQLGNIHYLQGDYKEAFKKYEQSLKINEELKDKSGIAIVLHQLGNIHYRQGDYKEAVKKYEQGLKIKERLEDKDGIARSYGQLGRINEEQKKYKKALEKYMIAFSILTKLQSPDAKIAASDLARLRQSMGENEFEKVRKELVGKENKKTKNREHKVKTIRRKQIR